MSGIYWLASYPKSGNTWLRVFLTNYQRNEDRPVDINELDGTGIGFGRAEFDDLLGLESSELTKKQIRHYRPLVYEEMAATTDEPLLLKVHDACLYTAEGRSVFSNRATLGAIYITRNPLDIAGSFAHHLNKSVDATIDLMGRDDAMLAFDGAHLPQRLRSWSDHVRSWLDEPDLNLHCVSYEEMIQNPEEVFTAIVKFLRFPVEKSRVRKAIRFSSFDSLKTQEAETGFQEKQPSAESFFRKGQAGTWRDELNSTQVDHLLRDHGKVMNRLGYAVSDVKI